MRAPCPRVSGSACVVRRRVGTAPRWTAFGVRHRARRLCPPYVASIATALLACLLWASAAHAETPFIPDEWRLGRRQESATLHYCVDARDPDLPVARKIREAL